MYMMIYHVQILFMGGTQELVYKGGETKIKVESEEHVPVMEYEIGKKAIQKDIGALVLLM